MIFDLLLILSMTLTGAFASLCLKRSSENTLFRTFFSFWFYGGAVLYLCASLLNIWALKNMDYSTVLPLTSITYIWTIILSKIFLKERISKKTIAGIIYIVIGAIFISASF